MSDLEMSLGEVRAHLLGDAEEDIEPNGLFRLFLGRDGLTIRRIRYQFDLYL